MSRRPLALGSVALATMLATGLAAAPTMGATPQTTAGPAAVAAAAYDPADANVVPVHISGDPENRWNLVILGDGYTAEEMGDFDEAVERHMNVMWSIEPYRSYKNYINVYAVQIPSVDSGTSCEDGPDGARLDTALNMQFWSGCRATGVERLLVMDNTKAKQYAQRVPEYDQILALANSSLYGGAGGSYATASADNAMSALISPHELGHSFGRLQDEYDYYNRGETTGDYTGREPGSIHHTIMSVEQMADQQRKWMALVHNFNRMDPDEQATLQSRMTEWARLSPAQRSQARLNFGEVRKVPADEKRAKWEEYQALPAEERDRLATEQPRPPRGAAPALRPVPPSRILRPPTLAPAPGTGVGAVAKPGNTRPTPPVDRNTLLPQAPGSVNTPTR